jgi:hypothetical protein
VETIQIGLKQPKTARRQPTQIVELPATGGWIHPVMAFTNWQKSRKEGMGGGKPVFRWGDGTLITLNEILEVKSVVTL